MLMLAEVRAMKEGTKAALSCKGNTLVWKEEVAAKDGKKYQVTIETSSKHPFVPPRVTITPEPAFVTNENKNRDGGIYLVSRDEYAGKMSILNLRDKAIGFINQK